MRRNMWPIFKSCKHQHKGAKDRLSQLPDDILLLIMSYLTMKEAARCSVVSKRMNLLWRCSPVLIFTQIDEGLYPRAIPEARSNFSKWVNKVVEAHIGLVIDELRVTFDLDKSCQFDVNKWVGFALLKQVKILELDTTQACYGFQSRTPIEWHVGLGQPRIPPFKYCLRSLTLKSVNITGQDVDCLLLSCTELENFCIESSLSLTQIRSIEAPLKLKHLEVSYCPHLRTIDIMAPKLLSFKSHGRPIELNIRNAYLLSEMSVGSFWYRGDVVAYAFDSLSKYFSQLEYLSWRMKLFKGLYNYAQFNLRIDNPPIMSKLKHLDLHVYAMCEQSFLGWADLIEACPLLQRLTVKFKTFAGIPRKLVKRNGRPLKSLKTLEFTGNLGLPIVLEFVTYVVENSMMLKDVIVECIPMQPHISRFFDAKDHDDQLLRILPQGVNLILKTGKTMQ